MGEWRVNPRSEGDGEQKPEPVDCPYCDRRADPVQDKERKHVTRFLCPVHGIVSARVEFDGFHWRGDIV